MSRASWIAAAFFTLAGILLPELPTAASATPEVTSIIEGRDTGTGGGVLVVIGKGVSHFTGAYLIAPEESGIVESAFLLKSKALLVLALPGGLQPGRYDLELVPKRGFSIRFPVDITLGGVIAGAIRSDSLTADLRTDLDDADTLDGEEGSYYRDAANLSAGSVNVARFSAFADLQAEDRIGLGSEQLATGNHSHPAQQAYSAGTGLQLSGGEFSVVFGGTGSSGAASRVDHHHHAAYLALDGGVVSGALTVDGQVQTTEDMTLLKDLDVGEDITVSDDVVVTDDLDVGGYSEFDGEVTVYGMTTLYGSSSPNLWVTHTSSTGNIAEFYQNGSRVARIDANGKGYFNGGTQSSGADVAESVVAAEAAALEPGDVLVINPKAPRRFARSSTAESSLVAGVYATRPGVLLRKGGVTEGIPEDEVPLAVVGIVPTKVCDEGGPIAIGDLLVTASKPGYAMKAGEDPKAGTVLGKGLGALDRGEGVIEVLLMAR